MSIRDLAANLIVVFLLCSGCSSIGAELQSGKAQGKLTVDGKQISLGYATAFRLTSENAAGYLFVILSDQPITGKPLQKTLGWNFDRKGNWNGILLQLIEKRMSAGFLTIYGPSSAELHPVAPSRQVALTSVKMEEQFLIADASTTAPLTENNMKAEFKVGFNAPIVQGDKLPVEEN